MLDNPIRGLTVPDVGMEQEGLCAIDEIKQGSEF
jgi:hypothetical protein